jgi:hypothetical protein
MDGEREGGCKETKTGEGGREEVRRGEGRGEMGEGIERRKGRDRGKR